MHSVAWRTYISKVSVFCLLCRSLGWSRQFFPFFEHKSTIKIGFESCKRDRGWSESDLKGNKDRFLGLHWSFESVNTRKIDCFQALFPSIFRFSHSLEFVALFSRSNNGVLSELFIIFSLFNRVSVIFSSVLVTSKMMWSYPIEAFELHAEMLSISIIIFHLKYVKAWKEAQNEILTLRTKRNNFSVDWTRWTY